MPVNKVITKVNYLGPPAHRSYCILYNAYQLEKPDEWIDRSTCAPTFIDVTETWLNQDTAESGVILVYKFASKCRGSVRVELAFLKTTKGFFHWSLSALKFQRLGKGHPKFD